MADLLKDVVLYEGAGVGRLAALEDEPPGPAPTGALKGKEFHVYGFGEGGEDVGFAPIGGFLDDVGSHLGETVRIGVLYEDNHDLPDA